MLFATEMWERFSFYTMQALLVLYATATLAEGGLEMGSSEAIALFGYYGAAVYACPLIGAYCADRYLGLQKSVVIGGALMAAGHFLMIFNQFPTFISALVLLAIGNGFFKPCITSLLGCLYDKRTEGRDAGYNIFYMGINVGALLAGLIGGWVQQTWGFHYAFAIAGFGMLIGQAIFVWGRHRFLEGHGIEPHGVDSSGAVLDQPLTTEEKQKVWAILLVCVALLLFFIGYWQYGGALTLYAENYTDRTVGGYEIPTAWFFSLNSFFIIVLCPFVSLLWARLARVVQVELDVKKILVGFSLTALSFWILWKGSEGVSPEVGKQSGPLLLVVYYLIITVGEYCIVPVIQAMISKIAPRRLLSRLMSLHLVAIGAAGILAGYLGGMIEDLDPFQIFRFICLLLTAFSALLFAGHWTIERLAGFRKKKLGTA
jgi:POT family proton-dependent oligopeptide transporter